jgi:hypothetical protein
LKPFAAHAKVLQLRPALTALTDSSYPCAFPPPGQNFGRSLSAQIAKQFLLCPGINRPLGFQRLQTKILQESG